MKKRSVSGNDPSSRPSLRRQTRANANNTTPTRNEGDNEKIQRKRHRTRLANIPESTDESSKRQDHSKRDTRLETPKSNKSAYLQDTTPFKDDLLLASQSYDAQCDVRWDCTSPDALRYIRKNRRRHHSSDVADIVQLLIPKEPQEEDLGSSTPPLLGLWMNSSNQPTHDSKDGQSAHRALPLQSSKLVRFRKKEKSRSNASRDTKMPTALLEKLKLAVEKCDGQSTDSTEETVGIENDTKKNASPEGFDQSKDLFASGESSRSMLNKVNTSPALNWSDDEIFENEDLLKATQDPDLESKDRRGNKRKSHEVEESKSKISKVCQDDNQEIQSNLPEYGKQSNLPEYGKQTKGLISYKMLQGKGRTPSPFRKVKSFNDIDQVQVKHSSDLRQSKGRKCLSLKNNDNTVKTVSSVSTSRGKGTLSSGITSDKSAGNVPTPNQISVDGTSKVLRNTVSSRASHPQFGLTDASSVNQSKVSANIAPDQSVSNSLKCQVNISSRTYVIPKVQNTSSCVVGSGVKNSNSTFCKSDSSVSKASTLPNASTTTTSRRRSSGMFDTSLSDDLLCQLAEPDEILDSHASQKTNNIVKSQSVGTLSLVGKPIQGTSTSTCVSVSCDKTKSSVVLPTRSKQSLTTGSTNTQTNSIVNQTGTGSCNIPGNSANSVMGQSQVSSSQRNKFKFKSKSPACGTDVQKPMSIVPSKMHGKLSSSVSAPNIGKLTAAPLTKTSGPLVDNSEDLFSSDDDELSEDQILALLETVEKEASQMPVAPQSQHCPKTLPNKCSMNEIEQKKHAAKAKLLKKKAEAVSPETLSLNTCTSPIKSSPTKYTQMEIEKKKQAALQKRRVKSKTTFPENLSVINKSKQDFVVRTQQNASVNNPITMKSNLTVSPVKFQQDSIERKRLAALEKLKSREDNLNMCVTSSSDRNSVSPGKCSQEDIERKKLAALERRKHASGEVTKARLNSDSSPGFSSSAESSPFKCTPEEIEKKKFAALAKLKIKKNLSSQLSSK
ncbi:micronuclear linker histone polyprotein-like isoform X2 [Argopecten irradians]|uniref:micronuclear linker histone polyprotein-like isoform X2 n=1 Tax=Argopecten irradians TaxID=31199 RepID=UPI0037244994